MLLVLAAGWFTARGPARAIGDGYDWRMVYAGARTWGQGGNPYSREDALGQLRAAGASEGTDALNLLYPPTGYALVGPLGFLSYRLSLWTWLSINLLATVGLLASVIQLNGLAWRSTAACLAAALVLLMAPLHTGLAKGQTGLVTVVLGLAGLVLAAKERAIIGGVLIAIATALKPQLGAAFIAPALLGLNLRHLVAAGVAFAGIAAIGIVPLQINAPTWWSDLQVNLHAFMTAGPGNPSPENPHSYQLINLHHPLHELVSDGRIVSIVVWSLGAAAVVCSSVLFVRQKQRHPCSTCLLVTSVWAAVLLMCTYHRAYDAIVLALPLGWAVANVQQRVLRLPAIVLLLLIALFFWPGPAVLRVAEIRVWLPQQFTATVWWQAFILPHQAWAILGVIVALLWAMLCLPTPGIEETTKRCTP